MKLLQRIKENNYKYAHYAKNLASKAVNIVELYITAALIAKGEIINCILNSFANY